MRVTMLLSEVHTIWLLSVTSAASRIQKLLIPSVGLENGSVLILQCLLYLFVETIKETLHLTSCLVSSYRYVYCLPLYLPAFTWAGSIVFSYGWAAKSITITKLHIWTNLICFFHCNYYAYLYSNCSIFWVSGRSLIKQISKSLWQASSGYGWPS